MDDINSLLADESFQRWLAKNASVEDNERWSRWLDESVEHRESYREALRTWELTRFRSAKLPAIDHEWDRLKARLNLVEGGLEPNTRPLPASYQRLQSREAWMRFGAVALAASVLLAIILRFIPFGTSTNSVKSDRQQIVSTNYGQRATLRLPDGTRIVLNANSTLKYPAVWNGQTARELQLHGEAYFDVADRPEGPQDDFIVLTDDGFIRVVGTKFVVYERGNGTRVVLEKGGVEVTPVDTSALRPLPAAKVLLKPGHLLYFKKGTHFLRPISVNVLPYMTWWLDQIVLQETPFAEIVQRLEETYGVKVEVRDKQLLKRTLSGSIENRNLEIITEALAKALRVSVQREGQTIIFEKCSS